VSDIQNKNLEPFDALKILGNKASRCWAKNVSEISNPNGETAPAGPGRPASSPVVFGAANGEAKYVPEHGRQVPRLHHGGYEGGEVSRVELPESRVRIRVKATDHVVHKLSAGLG